MKEHRRGFPGGPVVKNPLCNASSLPLMQQERNSRYSWLLLALRAAPWQRSPAERPALRQVLSRALTLSLITSAQFVSFLVVC